MSIVHLLVITKQTKKDIYIVSYSSGQELSVVHKFQFLLYGICCRLALEWV